MSVKTVSKGDTIITQGEMGRNMYVVDRGAVGIYLSYGQPEEKQLTVLRAGAYFGELSVIDGLPHSATAVAEDDSTLTVVSGDTLEEFLRENPRIALDIMKHMSTRLRAVTQDLMDACRAIGEAAEVLKTAEENAKTPEGERKSGLFERFKNMLVEYDRYAAMGYAVNAGYHGLHGGGCF